MSEEEREQYRIHFKELESKYLSIAGTLRDHLANFFVEANIAVFDVVYRIKKIESFLEKITRKNYKNPLEEIDDICGLRIIYYYNRDFQKIVNILSSEFEVKQSIPKEDELSIDRFGYRSYHIVACFKENWMNVPPFRNCQGLKFEIQIRTVLMHSWADISHQLFYKQENASQELQRRLFRLAALIEIADNEIDFLMSTKTVVVSDIDCSSLQSLLNKHFPDRAKSNREILQTTVAKEMNEHGISLDELEEATLRYRSKALDIEQEIFADSQSSDGIEKKWIQIGIIRTVMCFMSDTYWEQAKRKHDLDFIRAVESRRA